MQLTPVEAIKPLGAFAIALMWFSVAVLFNRWPKMREKSLSKHAAANKGAYWWMGIMQSILIPLFFAFQWLWLIPTFNLPVVYAILAFVSAYGFLTAAWVKADEGHKNKLHEILAYTAAFALAPQLFIIGFSGQVSQIARGLAFLVVGYMLYTMWLFFTKPSARNDHLAYQSSYFMLYHVAMLVTIYVR